jgi:putative tricarboxylic transport membrane protein
MRKLGDFWASLVLIFIGAGVIIGAIKLRVGSATEPQPGFFPFVGGVLLMVLSSILLVQAWRGRSLGTKAFGELRRPTILILGMVAYVIIFDWVGYVVATIILSGIVLRILETKSWWVLIAVSLVLSVGSYILFDRLLGVTLPNGILAKLL